MEPKPLYTGDSPTAYVHIPYAIVKEWLNLPPHAEILDMQIVPDDEEPHEGSMIFAVRHRDIPPEMAGKLIQGKWENPPRNWGGWRLVG